MNTSSFPPTFPRSASLTTRVTTAVLLCLTSPSIRTRRLFNTAKRITRVASSAIRFYRFDSLLVSYDALSDALSEVLLETGRTRWHGLAGIVVRRISQKILEITCFRDIACTEIAVIKQCICL